MNKNNLIFEKSKNVETITIYLKDENLDCKGYGLSKKEALTNLTDNVLIETYPNLFLERITNKELGLSDDLNCKIIRKLVIDKKWVFRQSPGICIESPKTKGFILRTDYNHNGAILRHLYKKEGGLCNIWEKENKYLATRNPMDVHRPFKNREFYKLRQLVDFIDTFIERQSWVSELEDFKY